MGIIFFSGWLLVHNFKHFGNLFQVISLVRSQYLYETESTLLVDGAIKGIVDALGDPYSVYLEPKTYTQLQDQIRGTFGGLGILVGIKDDFLTVARTYSGTPAHKAGIITGDIITRIGDRDAKGIDLDTAVQLMRGPVGTKVNLTLLRPGEKEPFTVPLTREEISVPTVEGKLLPDNLGYIVISQFSEKTPDELQKLLGDLKKQGLKGILLDLRDNPGGELQSVVKVSGNFIPRGPAVYIEYRGGRTEMLPAGGNNLELPLVVLVNGGSASAAEILAGAIKDTGSGTLVGQKTFGKGVVQTVFELDNGAGVKLTTARYLTPGKHDINKKGIVPDVTVSRGEKPGTPDEQFNRGLEVLKSKVGGKAA
nr:S41 family peptidase [Desulfocucumis palustris]